MGSILPRENRADGAEHVALAFGTILVQPLRPDDRAAYRRFLWRLEPEDIRLRMGRLMRADHRLYERLLDFDRSHEEAFVALDGDGAILGVGRIVLDASLGDDTGEIALIVRSDMKHRGIGEALLDRVTRFARANGLAEMRGFVLYENRPMLNLARKHGGRFVGALSSLVELRFPTA